MKLKLNRTAFKTFIENSKKKILRKKETPPAPVAPDVLAPINSTTSMVLEDDDKEALQSVLDAVHDPSILDIWRPIYYGLVSKTTIQIHASPERTVVISPPAGVMPPSYASLVNVNVGPRRMKTADLKVLRFLGEGTSGRVYMVRDTVTDMKMALKVVEKAEFNDLGLKTLVKERTTLQALEGLACVSQLHAAWHDDLFFYFAMDFYPTDLDSEMIRCGAMDPERARFYIAEMILGLHEIHARGILHRDIKAANMLISHSGHLVLADFGLAKNFKKEPTLAERVFQPYWPYLPDERVESGTPKRELRELHFVATTECGSELEMAPEVFLEEPYCFGVDFWGLAVVGFWMLTGRPPFYCDKDRPKLLRDQVIEDDLQWEPTDTLSDDAKDFFEKMLIKKPEDRLRIEFDMPCHSYFAGVDWELMRLHHVPPPWVPTPATRHAYKATTEQFKPGKVYAEDEDPIPVFEYNSEVIKCSGGWDGNGSGVEDERFEPEVVHHPAAETNLAGEESILEESFSKLFVGGCSDLYDDECSDDERSDFYDDGRSYSYADERSQLYTDEPTSLLAEESSDYDGPTLHQDQEQSHESGSKSECESDVSTVLNDTYAYTHMVLDDKTHTLNDAYTPMVLNDKAEIEAFKLMWGIRIGHAPMAKYPTITVPGSKSGCAVVEEGIDVVIEGMDVVVEGMDVVVEGMDVVVEGMDVVVEGKDVNAPVEFAPGAEAVPGDIAEVVPGDVSEIAPGNVSEFAPGIVSEIAPGIVTEITPGIVSDVTEAECLSTSSPDCTSSSESPSLSRSLSTSTLNSSFSSTPTSHEKSLPCEPRQYVVPHGNVNGTGVMFKFKVWMHTLLVPKKAGVQKRSLKRLTLLQ